MGKTFIIAEIGINHNGDLDIAKKLIDGAHEAGCDAVKFQKRTIEAVYTKEDLDRPRESSWGTTNREQKNGLEFNKKQYDEIDSHCKKKGIEWLASAWDIESQLFLRQYKLRYNKIASAMLTDRYLLETIAEERRHTFISTGMSTMEQIEKAVKIFKDAKCPYELLHCNSTYPMSVDQANLRVMDTLREKFHCDVGYSGHEVGLIVSCAAVALGAVTIERHITLDRLTSYIRDIERSFGSPYKKVQEAEVAIAKKLRRVDSL